MVMVIFNTTDEWKLRQRMVFNQEQAFILYNDVHQGREEGFTGFTHVSNQTRVETD